MSEYVHNICSCGCSRLVVPHHLRDAKLWASVALTTWDMRTGKDHVRFTVSYEPEADDKGWQPVTYEGSD
jgi:hypothetical protein